MNYQNMVKNSKKDKEIIKYLRSQITDLKNIINSKPNKYGKKKNWNSTTKINMKIINKKNYKKNVPKNSSNSNLKIHKNEEKNDINNNILISSNNIVITTNHNSDIEEENENENEVNYFNNSKKCEPDSNKKTQRMDSNKDDDFYTIYDEIKGGERNYSSVGKTPKYAQKNYKLYIQKINKINSKPKEKPPHNDLFEGLDTMKYARLTQSHKKSKSTHKNNNINNHAVEHVKTENNFITVNINTNSFGNGGFYLKKNRTLNSNNVNDKVKNGNKNVVKNRTNKNLNLNNNINSTTNRKNKFLNQKIKEKCIKYKPKNYTYKNNHTSSANSISNKRSIIKKVINDTNININNSTQNRNIYQYNKNKKNLQNSQKNKNKIKQRDSNEIYDNNKESLNNNSKDKINNKNATSSLVNLRGKEPIILRSCFSNSSSYKNSSKNVNRIYEFKNSSSMKKQNNENNNNYKNKEVSNNKEIIYNNLNINSNSNSDKCVKNDDIYSTEYDFNIPEKYLNSDSKIIKSTNSKGKIINIYDDNKKEIIFQSGVRKEIFEDGFQIVHFMNGDKKLNYTNGKMVYFFHDAKTVQTNLNNGIQVFKFNNGQIERHFPDNTKQICFPDGTQRFIKDDGSEETYYANGSIQ